MTKDFLSDELTVWRRPQRYKIFS